MKKYISIPISTPGYEEHIQRRKANEFQKEFEAQGFEVVNPFELGDILERFHKDTHKPKPTHAEYMKVDIEAMQDCDVIFFCDGYYRSKGCMEEHQEAINLNKKKEYENIQSTARGI